MGKVTGVLLVILAASGLLLCSAGLIGVWVVNAPLTSGVQTTAQAAVNYLQTSIAALDVTEARLLELRTQLDAFSSRIDAMTPESRAALTAQFVDAVQRQIGPDIATLRTTLATVRAGVVALNHSLVAANRIPGVNVPTFTEELQAADQRLGEAQAQVATLRAALADASIDGSQLRTLVDALSTQLATSESILASFEAQLLALREVVLSIDSAAPGVIDMSTIVLSLLFVLFGAGQFCLLRRAWALLRSPQSTEAA